MSKIYLSPCPCRNCTLREIGCHNNCKHTELTYNQWLSNSIEKPVNIASPGRQKLYTDLNKKRAIKRER